MTAEVSPRPFGTIAPVFVSALVTEASKVGTWSLTASGTASFLGGYVASSGAVDEEISWDVYLPAGTYTLDLLFRADTATGIYTVTIDGVALTGLGGSAATVDGYAGVAAATRSSVTGIVIPSGGVKRVKFKMATKNASASAYTAKLSAFAFVKTA